MLEIVIQEFALQIIQYEKLILYIREFLQNELGQSKNENKIYAEEMFFIRGNLMNEILFIYLLLVLYEMCLTNKDSNKELFGVIEEFYPDGYAQNQILVNFFRQKNLLGFYQVISLNVILKLLINNKLIILKY